MAKTVLEMAKAGRCERCGKAQDRIYPVEHLGLYLGTCCVTLKHGCEEPPKRKPKRIVMQALTPKLWHRGKDGRLNFVCPYCGDDFDHPRDCPWTIDDPCMSPADQRLVSKLYAAREGLEEDFNGIK